MPVLDGNFEAFVTNLGKYNEGMLVGEWVKLPTTEEEMQKVFERIGIGKQDEFCLLYTSCVLPEQITSPSMTAEWENTLMEIERGKADADAFLSLSLIHI